MKGVQEHLISKVADHKLSTPCSDPLFGVEFGDGRSSRLFVLPQEEAVVFEAAVASSQNLHLIVPFIVAV